MKERRWAIRLTQGSETDFYLFDANCTKQDAMEYRDQDYEGKAIVRVIASIESPRKKTRPMVVFPTSTKRRELSVST